MKAYATFPVRRDRRRSNIGPSRALPGRRPGSVQCPHVMLKDLLRSVSATHCRDLTDISDRLHGDLPSLGPYQRTRSETGPSADYSTRGRPDVTRAPSLLHEFQSTIIHLRLSVHSFPSYSGRTSVILHQSTRDLIAITSFHGPSQTGMQLDCRRR